MKRDYLISKIAEDLKGKSFRNTNYDIERNVFSVFSKYFNKEELGFITFHRPNQENVCYIRYKGRSLFALRFTKTFKQRHCEWFSHSYCEWLFKDFSCADQEEDFELEQKMNEIENTLRNNEEIKQKTFEEMLEHYHQIKALFGDKTNEVLNYIQRHHYELEKGKLL